MRPDEAARALSSQRMGGRYPIHEPQAPTLMPEYDRPHPLAQRIERARDLWYALYGERKGEKVDWWLHALQHHRRER